MTFAGVLQELETQLKHLDPERKHGLAVSIRSIRSIGARRFEIRYIWREKADQMAPVVELSSTIFDSATTPERMGDILTDLHTGLRRYKPFDKL